MRRVYLLSISIGCAVMLAILPLAALAEETEQNQLPPSSSTTALPPLIITELQTAMPGSGNASKEFIELYNTTSEPINLATWQLWYISATADSLDQPTRRIAFASTEEAPLRIEAGAHFVLSGSEDYLSELRSAVYSATLATNGHLRILQQAADYASSCELVVSDAVSWGTAVPASGMAAVAPAAGKSLERLRTAEGVYIDTDNAGQDFAAVDAPSPAELNALITSDEGVAFEPTTVHDTDCTVESPPPPANDSPEDSPPSTTLPSEETTLEPEPEEETNGPTIPTRNNGLRPPQLSELLPNPAAPQTDDNDEFIELYNPNEAPFELSGYVLEAGLTTTHRYTFPEGTLLPGKTFTAYFSADTHLALSNTGGQVRLFDPLHTLVTQSDPYGAAKDGQAWLLANGTWQWTTKPTPNALNAVIAAPVKVQTAKATASKKKTTSVKSATTPKNVGASTATQQVAQTTTTSRSPLHPGVLALVAISALLYGAYEYRRDVANKIYQFRSNRAARRALRQGTKGG